MPAISLFLRTTIVGGAFFLMPIVGLAHLLNKALDFARRGLKLCPLRQSVGDALFWAVDAARPGARR